MSKEIKSLIKKILRFYTEKEAKSKSSYKFYSHNEFDANNSNEFEELSNARYIGIKSKLPKDDIIVLMNIFQSIVTDNYWIFEIDDIMEIIEDNGNDDNITDEQLSDYSNVEIWIKVLTIIGNEFSVHKEQPMEEKGNLLHNRETGKLTNPEFKYFQQKYYYVSELNTKMKFRSTVVLC